MAEAGLLVAVFAETEFEPVCLERFKVGYRTYFEPLLLSGAPNFKVVGHRRGEAHIAAAETDDAVGETEFFHKAFYVQYHHIQRLITLVGVNNLYEFHFVEFVETIETLHVCAVTASLAAETRCVGAMLDWELLGVEDFVAVDVGDWHFGGGHEVEVVNLAVVHLAFLVGQLTCAKT